MSTPPRKLATFLTLFLLPLSLISCSERHQDGSLVGAPDIEASGAHQTPIRSQADQAGPGPAWTIRDEFAGMARRAPGGFGGLYFDGDRRLVILLQDTLRADEARAALTEEAFVQRRQSGPLGDEYDLDRARLRAGTYSYDQLLEWYEQLVPELGAVMREGSIPVARNRIRVGVSQDAERIAVTDALDRTGIPSDAVVVEIAKSAELSSTLHDRFSIVPGGVQIELPEAPAPATVGPQVNWMGQQHAFLVASHYSKHPFDTVFSDADYYYQPTSPNVNHLMGNKALDPELFACGHSGGCRNSDAALAIYDVQGPWPDLGRIARPEARNTLYPWNVNIDQSDPFFEIVEASPGGDWSLPGEIIEKVGRTTGWTGGEVVDECQDKTWPYPSWIGIPGSFRILCMAVVEAVSAGGDSGGPVFRILGDPLSETDVELRGVQTGGVCDSSSCWFWFSQLGGIQADLDPWGMGHLRFF